MNTFKTVTSFSFASSTVYSSKFPKLYTDAYLRDEVSAYAIHALVLSAESEVNSCIIAVYTAEENVIVAKAKLTTLLQQ